MQGCCRMRNAFMNPVRLRRRHPPGVAEQGYGCSVLDSMDEAFACSNTGGDADCCLLVRIAVSGSTPYEMSGKFWRRQQ